MKQSEDKSEATRGAVGNTASKVRCVDHETHKATASDVEQIKTEALVAGYLDIVHIIKKAK